jgi:cytochrome c
VISYVSNLPHLSDFAKGKCDQDRLTSDREVEDEDFKQALLGDPSLVDAKRALERLGSSEPAATDSDELVRKGKVLAEKNCGGCHGLGAAGVSLNKDATAFQNIFREHKLYALRRPVAQAILAAHEKMPQFNASSQDVDTIVAYINSFSTGR